MENLKKVIEIFIILIFVIICGKLGYITYYMEAPNFNSCGGVLLLEGPGSHECGKAQTLITSFIFVFLATVPIFLFGWGFISLNLYVYIPYLIETINKQNKTKKWKIYSIIVKLSILPLLIFFFSLIIFNNPVYIFNPVSFEDSHLNIWWYYILWLLFSPFIYICGSRFILSKWRIKK